MKRCSAVVVIVVALSALCSCSAAAGPPVPAPPAAVVAVQPPGATGDVLVAYEQLRTLLAADSVEGIGPIGTRLLTAAQIVAEKKGAGGAEVVAAVGPLSVVGVDLVKARQAFGEISRGVVALIAADKTLQAGRFLFSCPMARGYQRWVQTAPKMANPYMGSRMLECGEAVAVWAVDG